MSLTEQILFNTKKFFNYFSLLKLASNISEWYDKQYNKLLNNYCDEIKNIIQEKYGIKPCNIYDYDFGLMYYLKDAKHNLSEEEALEINSRCHYNYVNIPKSSTSPIFISAIIMDNDYDTNFIDFHIANVYKNLLGTKRDISVENNVLNVCKFGNKKSFKKAVKTGVEWLEKVFLDYGVIGNKED